MPTQYEKTMHSSKAQPAQQGKTPVPPEIKQLADLVILLNILKKNLAIYPAGHHLIAQSSDAASEALEKCFLVSPVVTVGAVKESLFVGGRRIEGKSTVFRDFAVSLTRLGIASLSLAKGLGQEELLRLQRLLSLRPEDIRAQGDIASLAEAAQLPNVKIRLVDYSMFRSSEEAVIKGPSEQKPSEQLNAGVDIWDQFIKGLKATRPKGRGPSPNAGAEGGEAQLSPGGSAGGIDNGTLLGVYGGGDGVLEAGTELNEGAGEEELSPGMIVRMLNDGTLPVEQAVQSYADVLAQFAGMGFQRHMLGKEALRFFDRMNIILHNLKGGIRNRFLKAAFTHMSLLSGQDAMEELLKCFPADLAAEMMGVADHEGHSLSPALQKLMSKFSAVQDGMTEQEALSSAPSSGAELPFMEALQILPKRENYEKHMTPDYVDQLDTLSRDAGEIKPPPEFSLDEHLESLGKQSLDMHIGRVLIALMDQDVDPAVYHDFTQKVIELVPELLDAGSFRPMFVIFSTLRQHIASKEQADIRALAKMALQIFFEPAFVMQMVAQLAEAGDDASNDLLDMLRETGQQAIPELLDLYANHQSLDGNRRLFELLCSFGSPVVDVALTRLYSRSFFYVRNLLRFIKAAGDASVVPHVRPLLKHSDHDLRREALEVLLTFKDQSAAAALRQLLRSQSMAEISQAVQMIHEHRVVGLGAELLSLIKIIMPFESDTALNCMVLHALGEVGDPAMLQPLQKIAQARLTLFPGNLRKTKRALFESLQSYPQAAVRELLEIGLRSGDELIRKICRSSPSDT